MSHCDLFRGAACSSSGHFLQKFDPTGDVGCFINHERHEWDMDVGKNRCWIMLKKIIDK